MNAIGFVSNRDGQINYKVVGLDPQMIDRTGRMRPPEDRYRELDALTFNSSNYAHGETFDPKAVLLAAGWLPVSAPVWDAVRNEYRVDVEDARSVLAEAEADAKAEVEGVQH